MSNDTSNNLKSKDALLEELKANRAKISSLERQNDLLSNRIGYFKNGERKKRSHRLITRGAAIESIEPDLKMINEADFYNLMENIFNIPEVRKLLEITKASLNFVTEKR